MSPTLNLLSMTIFIVPFPNRIGSYHVSASNYSHIFPFLRTVTLPMFVEYRTRQVLNLARFVAPFCIYSLYMLSTYNCNILRHEV